MNALRISRFVTHIIARRPKDCFMPGVIIKGERICDCTTQCNYLINNITAVRMAIGGGWLPHQSLPFTIKKIEK